MPNPDPLADFRTALERYQTCRGEFVRVDNVFEQDGDIKTRVPDWIKAETARAVAAEGLWVSGMASLFDALEHYTEAAAKDRESQALAREAREREQRAIAERDDRHMAVQRRQGWITLGFTVVIAFSTAIYTVAAWKQAKQSERTIAPATISAPASLALPK